MVSFIDAHRKVYGFEPICRVLPIALPPTMAHTATRVEPAKRSARALCDDALRPEVGRVFEENSASTASARSGGSYGGKGSTSPATPLPA